MKKRSFIFIFLASFISILIYILLVITQKDNGVFSKVENQWIEKQENTVVTYSINDAINLDLSLFLETLSQMTNLNLSEGKDQAVIKIDSEELIKNKDYTTITTIGQLTFSCYSSKIAITKTADLNLYRIGMLQSDSKTLDLTNEYGINPIAIAYYDDKETLIKAYFKGELDVIILQDTAYSLIIEGQMVANRIWELYLEQDKILLAVQNEEVVLQSILNKAIAKMDQIYGLSNLVNNFNDGDYKHQFLSLLTEEERVYLENTPIVNGGLVLKYPLTYQQEDKLYGIPIGVLSDISKLTGLTFEYILGEEEELINSSEVYDIEFYINSHRVTEALIDTNPYIVDRYVLVGLSDSPDIKDLYQLRPYSKGLLFNNVLSTPVETELEKGVVRYFQDYDTMLEQLLSRKVHYVVMPKSIYGYYKGQEAYTAIEDYLELEATYVQSFKVNSENMVLQSILNKGIQLIDIELNVDESLGTMPRKVNRQQSIYIAVLTFILINILFFGGYYIRYRINLKEKERLTYLFTTDQLTYLPNRYGLQNHLDRLIKSNQTGYLYYISIDNFKIINNKLGQQLGDQVILEYSRKLLSLVTEESLLGRIAGSNFVLISCSGKEIQETLESIKILTEEYLETRIEIDALTNTIAIVEFPVHGNTFDGLFIFAEHTHDYIIRNFGGNYALEFQYGIYEAYVNERALVEEIKVALKDEQFQLYVQPQIILPSEKVVGGEVLVRWAHPVKGMIYPNDFIPVAEKNGLMKELDYYMLSKACAEIKRWQSEYETLKISVNMATSTFTDRNLVDKVAQYIKASGIDPSWLVIEATEDTGFEDLEKANKVFQELNALDVKIALDDFGKGYSSLSYLGELTFDILKIDKSFIDNIHKNQESFEIYQVVSRLAEIMKVPLIAEGVEYIEQVNLLKRNPGTIVQGYYYSKPITIEAFDQFLRDYS